MTEHLCKQKGVCNASKKEYAIQTTAILSTVNIHKLCPQASKNCTLYAYTI